MPLSCIFCVFVRLGDNFCKYLRVFGSHLRQDLAIQSNVLLAECAHHLAVAFAHFFESSADANLLKAAIVAFFGLATNIGIDASFDASDFSEGNLGFAAPHHALGTGEDILAALDAVGSAFDTWHRSSVVD